jgi:hypothetical protein
MKQLFTILALLLVMQSQAQIALENTYSNYIFPIHLESAGSKYAILDDNIWELKIYNLDHSIYKTITVTNPNTALYDASLYPNREGFNFAYVKEGLFDTDSEIEFMLYYVVYDAAYINFLEATVIINEDGSVLFSRNNVEPRIGYNSEQTESIVKASDGTTKMILIESPSSGGYLSHVYSLPGTLQCDPCGGINGVGKIAQGESTTLMQNYPNPATEYTVINYELPENVTDGILSIYNTAGIQLKEYQIDTNFDHLRVSTQELPAGTYYYSVHIKNGQTQSKKMVVVK